MSDYDKLIIRKREDHLRYAHRLIQHRLTSYREVALYKDGNHKGVLPRGYGQSVEHIVMDVSDLAQAHGYFTALLEREE